MAVTVRPEPGSSLGLFALIAHRRWVPVAGYLSYVVALAAGYYYNLTFIQLGLIDLGTRLVGMTSAAVSAAMAALALSTLVVAVAAGVVMDRRGWSRNLQLKLRLLFAITSSQLALTLIAPRIATPGLFVAWVIACSIPLGAGIPVLFGAMIDFIPVRERGFVAATVAGLAFFVAALYPVEWRIEEFSVVVATAMAPAVAVLGVLAFKRPAFMNEFSRPAFGTGRFCHPRPVKTGDFTFLALIFLMFGIFFIDSLGFLRIIEAPVYIHSSWQSPDPAVRLFIAVTHLVAALMAGVLYTNFSRRWIFLWACGLFAFTHLLYTFHLRTGPEVVPPLIMPMFYVVAVSFYTTLNFAVWPDHSTADTIGTHTALGVGVAGWLASFLSTALALYSESSGLSLLSHLTYVNALALTLLLALPLALYVRRMVALARSPGAR